MAKIDAKYEAWKNKLLDLGRKNRLLNYKDTRLSNLKILSPNCTALWNSFVKNEVPIEFPLDDVQSQITVAGISGAGTFENGLDELIENSLDSEYGDFENESADSQDDGSIKTNKNAKDLIKTLRNLRSKAKTVIEEQGVNVLYLSFGFLNWNDDGQSLVAPLVLVPVTLTVESIRAPFVLSLHEDEIVLNPTLAYKLETDFGITLPAFDDNEDIDDFLEQIRKKVKVMGWTVTDEVSLSLLSFLKINMYSDLKSHKETILQNPIVNAVGGNTEMLEDIPSEILNYDFDKNERPVDVFQVVDADASQQDAILMAKKGISFVLQGPPGTGKSQTITNIIAESLAEGKKVLFVSEKMAALDVVHRRLSGAGLDDFCLVLHSHKANKKNVLDQLSKVLALSKRQAKLSDEAYNKLNTLQSDKERLNAYAEQIYNVVEPLQKSIYEVNGIIASLEEYEDLIFNIDGIRNVSEKQYSKYINLLNRFVATVGKMTDDYKKNPWRNANLESVSNEFRQNVISYADKLLQKLWTLDSLLDDTLDRLHLDYGHTVNNIRALSPILEVASRATPVPSEWVTEDGAQCLYAVIDRCTLTKKTYFALISALSEQYSVICENENRFNLSSAECLLDKEALERERDNIISTATTEFPYLHWYGKNIDRVTELLANAEARSQKIHSFISAILEKYTESAFSLDCNAMLLRIVKDYKWFSDEFTSDCEEFARLKSRFSDIVKDINREYSVINANELRARLALLNADDTKIDWDGEEQKILAMRDGAFPYSVWSSISVEEISALLKKAKENAAVIASLKSKLLKDYENEVFKYDYQALLRRIKGDYTSFTRAFSKQYRQDKKDIRMLHRNIGQKIKYEDMVDLAQTLKSLNEVRQWYVDNGSALSKTFGDLAINEDTDYALLEKQLLAFVAMDKTIRLIFDVRKVYVALKPLEDMLALYENDKQAVISCLRGEATSVENSDIVWLVQQLCSLSEERAWFDNEAESLTLHFGNDSLSEKSDYVGFNKQLTAYNALTESLNIINKAIAIFDNAGSEREQMLTDFQFLYKGPLSNWESISASLDWALEFKNSVSDGRASVDFITSVCGGELVDECGMANNSLCDALCDLSEEYDWFTSRFNACENLDDVELLALRSRFEACANGLALLEEWIDYRNVRELCTQEGLGDFMRAVEEHNVPSQNIHPIFKKRFFRLWLDTVLPEYPAVSNFRRRTQEALIDEFASLDKLQFEIAKARIKSKLINSLPSLEHFTSGVDEISILKREINKQRRIMPIRRLFKAIPNLLLTLKPCLMMSPLSVSLFLEAETYKFDVVIFDEASQVCTENAIGAISRAKQVIIAGDSKQLPPTSFFQSTVSEGDFDSLDDDDDDLDDDFYESILDEANMLPERTLRWHYRSRHESLIAFSNAKIYNNNLVTFPSNIEQSEDNGVEYIYVPNGTYDRGGKNGNMIEAKRVAELVFQHINDNPNRSLGVIAFGEAQQQIIETMIRAYRCLYPECEDFFAEDKEEAFFVKNLENVQGDERDTIIFSIGYAKDSNGVFRMNFGPLSKSGGERRLNVAITRAKYNVKLVGSILPTDILTENISADGPNLLRSYIEFAMNGASVIKGDIAESDTADTETLFEESVYRFLSDRGYELEKEVGCSGYKIDIAVRHPRREGIYVLGIECDGAAYHSARTARERERLRQEVLEKMGWQTYRVWSTDWIKDPITEGKRLVEAIEAAIENYDFFADGDFEDDNDGSDEACAEDFVNVENKDMTDEENDNPYGFESVQIPDFTRLPRSRNGSVEITDCIMEVVNKEYPIHFELLCQRLAHLFGNEKATVKIRREVDYGLSRLGKRVIRKGDFIFPMEYTSIPIRLPNTRKIQQISVEELAEATYRILRTCVGTNRKALSLETARVYGFSYVGSNISVAMSNAIDRLIEQCRIDELEGKLRVRN